MDYSRHSRQQLEEALLSDDVPSSRQTWSALGCNDTAEQADASHRSICLRRALLRTRLAVARELLLREAYARLVKQSTLNSPEAAREYLRLHFAHLAHEVFVVVLLDAQNQVLACEEAFRGTLTQTAVYPREVVRTALWHGAAACLFAHNHPSGAAEPSRADELLTRTLRDALALVDVRVVDHLVFAGGRFASFAERGLI